MDGRTQDRRISPGESESEVSCDWRSHESSPHVIRIKPDCWPISHVPPRAASSEKKYRDQS